MILPFYWMVITSLKPEADVLVFPPKIIPDRVTLDNYILVIQRMPLIRMIFNSLFVTIIGTALSLLMSSIAGYTFAKIKFKGRNVLFIALLGIMMIPQQVTIVPLFIIMNKANLLDSYLTLILPSMFNIFGIFMMRQFFITIPKELEEAAIIDGASRLRTFFTIMLPLAKTQLATLGIVTFIGIWNDYLWPLVSISSEKYYTLPIGLSSLQGRWVTEWGLIMSGTVISVLPMMIAYVIMQRSIIRSVVNTGIK